MERSISKLSMEMSALLNKTRRDLLARVSRFVS